MVSAFWYGILVVSALAFAIVRLSLKRLVTAHGALPSLFLFECLGTIVLLPIALIFGTFPSTLEGWLLLALLMVLLLVGEYLAVKSYETVGVSEREPILATAIFFVMVLGVVFLNETVTRYDVIGSLFIFAGVLVLSWKHGVVSFFRTRGHFILLIVAFGTAIDMLLNVLVLKETAVVSLAATGYAICAVVYGIILRKRFNEVRAVLRTNLRYLLLSIASSLVAYLLLLWAVDNIGAIVPTLFARLTPIFVVIGAYVFFHEERRQISRTSVAVALTIIGCIFVIL